MRSNLATVSSLEETGLPSRVKSDDSSDAGVLRPPLKWAGGKRWQVPLIRRLYEPHRGARLVEPFCGGLAVSLGLNPGRALLNDINQHLINFYCWLRRGLRVELDLRNDASVFYSYRERFNLLLDSGHANTSEAAVLFYYLNRTGYNGLCRFNRRGHFNVPFGRYKNPGYRRDFSEYEAGFRPFSFSSFDFEALILADDDFVYADPPYDVPFTQYSKDGFTWDDQERTARWLSKHPGPVVLVNQDTPRIRKLYRSYGYVLQSHPAPRLISCTGDRRPVMEVLATRNM